MSNLTPDPESPPQAILERFEGYDTSEAANDFALWVECQDGRIIGKSYPRGKSPAWCEMTASIPTKI